MDSEGERIFIVHSCVLVCLCRCPPGGRNLITSSIMDLELTSHFTGPTLIGTQNALGVGPSSDALLFVICSPVRDMSSLLLNHHLTFVIGWAILR